jgi:hemolysin III
MVASPGADLAVLVSLGIYGAGLLAMLGCSALCNTARPGPLKELWRRLDHAAIFVMIAGTYTPFAAIAIGGAWGTGLLVFVWAVAAAGVVLKLLRLERLETLSIAAYLLLGWTILVAIDRLIAAVSLPAFVLLVAGGIIYSLGILFYRSDRLPYSRAVWHAFVLTAAACQYFAILDVVANYGR